MQSPHLIAPLTNKNLAKLNPSTANNSSRRRRSVENDHNEHRDQNGVNDTREKPFPQPQQKVRSKASHSQSVHSGGIQRDFRIHTHTNGFYNRKAKLSDFGVSSLSHKSQESNGFVHKNSKPERVYFDGRATYFSGRLTVPKPATVTMTSSRTFNRSLRDKDTFLSIFPNYRISHDPKHSVMQCHFRYPKKGVEGSPTHFIDRTYTRKMDFMKKYNEEMLKVASMKRR
jgi:hypothetical protein